MCLIITWARVQVSLWEFFFFILKLGSLSSPHNIAICTVSRPLPDAQLDKLHHLLHDSWCCSFCQHSSFYSIDTYTKLMRALFSLGSLQMPTHRQRLMGITLLRHEKMANPLEPHLPHRQTQGYFFYLSTASHINYT